MLVTGSGNSDRFAALDNVTTNAPLRAVTDIRNLDLLSVQLMTTDALGVLGGAGMSLLTAVRVATTANRTLSTGFANGQTIDGVVVATNDRILIKNQTDATKNGVYVVQASGAPVRATDADTAAELFGMSVNVTAGTVNAGLYYTNTNPFLPTLGTSNITYGQTVLPALAGSWTVEVSNSYSSAPDEIAGANSNVGKWVDITADFTPAIPSPAGTTTGQSWPVTLSSLPYRHIRFTFTPSNGTAFAVTDNQRAGCFLVGKSRGN